VECPREKRTHFKNMRYGGGRNGIVDRGKKTPILFHSTRMDVPSRSDWQNPPKSGAPDGKKKNAKMTGSHRKSEEQGTIKELFKGMNAHCC